MEHRLVNDTLIADDKGIVARCICGWSSGYRFSSFVASAMFSEHKDYQLEFDHPNKHERE